MGLRRQLIADGSLLIVTLIWGSTFVMVKEAVAAYPVFSFLALRFLCAALVLAPVVWWRRRGRTGGFHPQTGPFPGPRGLGYDSAQLGSRLWAPFLIGLALFAGYGFQTAGLHLTTPAKAGFITGLSVVMVPAGAALFLQQASDRGACAGVALALAGLALLSLQADLRLAPGDLLVFCCAVAFAAHILLTGRFARRYDPLALTLGQVVVVAALCGVWALLFEVRPPLSGTVVFAAAFTGILATSFAFGIQTLAQRFTTATHTALIFAAEPVFAGLFSLLLIGEVLGPRQLLGGGLILAGMVAAELKRS